LDGRISVFDPLHFPVRGDENEIQLLRLSALNHPHLFLALRRYFGRSSLLSTFSGTYRPSGPAGT
jgi:hypothetical protein